MAEPDELENSEKQSSWGGKRPGSGRKPGTANQSTIWRAKVKRELQDRIAAHAEALLNSQLTLAKGVSYLYRIDKDSKGNNLRPVLVTIPGEIEDYLAGNADEDSYYYITTERPENRAIDSMLDRTFGKAEQSLDLKNTDGSLKPLVVDSTVAGKFIDAASQPTEDSSE